MNDHYVLIGQTPVEEPDLLTWARWFEESGNRIVAQDYVGNVFVSTVFLGLDHNFDRMFNGKGEPILFETMAFYHGHSLELCDRCSDWLQAERQHARICAEFDNAPAQLRAMWYATKDSFSDRRYAVKSFWRRLTGSESHLDRSLRELRTGLRKIHR